MAVFLSLGTNLGEKLRNIIRALRELANFGKIENVSNLYETEPVDMKGENFYNCVVKYRTYLPPYELLRVIKRIEKDLGRDPSQGHNMPRVIDIDILLYDNLVIQDKELTIPHPKLLERDFLLRGLLDIEDELFLSIVNRTLASIYSEKFKDSVFKLVREKEKLLEDLFAIL